jgi:uncharacterized membrane protein
MSFSAILFPAESLDGFFAQFYMDSQGTSLAFILLFSLEG